MCQNPVSISVVEDDITVITLNEPTLSGFKMIEEISQKIRSFVTAVKPINLVIDFSSVRFLSSQLLGLLVDIWKKIGEYGGNFVISGINPQLTRVFRITNLDKIFHFESDISEAVKTLNTKKV